MREICSGNALGDAPLEQRQDRCALVGGELPAVHISRIFVPQPRAEEYELGRFVERVVGAVAEPQMRFLEQQRAV